MILHEAIVGCTPFKGDSPIAVGFAACMQAVPPLRSTRADVTEAWDAFVHRAIAEEPEGRFSPAAEMRAALPSA
ncbi:MAG: hypothetical protein HYV09_28405 [Deltaproteobacteria bacterium]|nr:hypothetical protein [Deltaproteobacteria bacterium]